MRRLPNVVVVALICAGTLGVFGPHLMMLGYKVAGARPPSALLYFCVLHQAEHGKSPLRIAGGQSGG